MLRTRREPASTTMGFDAIAACRAPPAKGQAGLKTESSCAAAIGNPFADHGNARSKSLEDDRRIALEGYERFRSIMSLRRQASHMSHPFFFNAPPPQAKAS